MWHIWISRALRSRRWRRGQESGCGPAGVGR